MRNGSGGLGKAVGGAAAGWLAAGLWRQRRLARSDRDLRGRGRRDSRRGVYGRVRDLSHAHAGRGRGAAWTTLAAFLLKRSFFTDVRRAVAIGSLLGAVTWAAGELGFLQTPRRPIGAGSSRVAHGAWSLLSQIAAGVFSVMPLYVSARMQSAKQGLRNGVQSVRAT